MPLYVIERKYADQIDLDSDGVKALRRSTPTRACAGCSPS